MYFKRNTRHAAEYKVGWRLQFLLVLALFGLALELMGQQRSSPATSAKGEVQGSLRVTLTVQSSVGIVIDKDGQPQVIVANAPDVRDGVVYLSPAPNKPLPQISAEERGSGRAEISK